MRVSLVQIVPAGPDPAGGPALDLLCVAPHPDDAELGMGGTLALEAASGHRVGILDLSRGEMASNGTPADRLRESANAATILGLAWRGNLGLPDRNLGSQPQVLELARVLRQLRPDVLCLPHPDDPHPDHGAAHRLIVEAVFSSGLRRLAAAGPPHRPRVVLQYFINGWAEPTFTCDVSVWRERKRAAVLAHASQFLHGEVATRLNSGGAIAQVEGRDRYFGGQTGVEAAEGFCLLRPLPVSTLSSLGRAGTHA